MAESGTMQVAMRRSRLKLHESQDRSPTLLSHRRRTATFTDDLLRALRNSGEMSGKRDCRACDVVRLR